MDARTFMVVTFSGEYRGLSPGLLIDHLGHVYAGCFVDAQGICVIRPEPHPGEGLLFRYLFSGKVMKASPEL